MNLCPILTQRFEAMDEVANNNEGSDGPSLDFVQEEKVPLELSIGPDMGEMDAFDEDLYGDLAIDMSQEMTYTELKQLYEGSQHKVKELLKENQVLKEQNLVLKKNISSLYLTAREEIQRKDAQLRVHQEREMKKKVAYSRQQATERSVSAD